MTDDVRAAEAAAPPPGQEKLVIPGMSNSSKLPLPIDPTSAGAVPPELKEAWTQYLVGGFKQNEQMFQRTLKAFMKPSIGQSGYG
jgi:hypothetical protein